MTDPLLHVQDLTVDFDSPHGALRAVRGVDLEIEAGEVLALVGESGSGKSAFARALLRMNQPPFTTPRTTVGGKAFLSRPEGALDLVSATPDQIRAVRTNAVAMIFQDALTALNPVLRIGAQVTEAMGAADPEISPREAAQKTVALLDEVGIQDPARRVRDFPHQLSGGQRQRVMIAIAMARRPALLIADEPTTALDVTVQARVLALLKRLQQANSMAMLFITHDLAVVQRIASRVAVMYAGRIVETGPIAEVFAKPRHPYTRGLLQSRPGFRRHGEGLSGTSPDPRRLPEGCAFAPRCPQAGPDCTLPPPMRDGARCVRPLA